MTTKVRIAADYQIETLAPIGNPVNTTTLTLTSPTVIIDGNLQVLGQTSEIKTSETIINDNIITLNGGVLPSESPQFNAGIEINRGNQPNVAFRWNEAIDKWEFSNDGTAFFPVAAGSSGTFLSNVIEDMSPQLGGDLDMNGKRIVTLSNDNIVLSPDGTGIIQAMRPLRLFDQVTVPASVINYNTVYSAAPSGGGTGLYVTNATVNQELVSKSKAIVYAIIF